MPRRFALASVPALMLLVGAGAASQAASGVVSVRTACDADGRCYETGDPSLRDDDDRPASRRRLDRDDDDATPSQPRRRFDRDDD